MKLIEILVTEVLDNPYDLTVIGRNFMSKNAPKRYYTAKFTTDNNMRFEVEIEEDQYSIKNKPTFNLGFTVYADSETSDPVPEDDFEPDDDGVAINRKTGNRIVPLHSKRTGHNDPKVLSTVIQHVKNFKNVADKLTSMNKGYAIIFTPAEEWETGTDGNRREKRGSAEKLGKLYRSIVIYVKKNSKELEGVEFTKSTRGHFQLNFNGYKGQYLHKHPTTGIEKIDRAIDKVSRKVDKAVVPIARKIINDKDIE